ncbi:Hypothetical protein SCLAV_p0138 (plasmid) [Streptomyces clavuligerus]|uniref:Uncharacterized protein n=1 Tax=Streptomyces clavuligerus TaxID=1901 RepID=D5SI86_STRCL|nr:Hypothetical protein SCLAV_p0138 [Streptomyces clavuligerus]
MAAGQGRAARRSPGETATAYNPRCRKHPSTSLTHHTNITNKSFASGEKNLLT